MLRRVGSYPPCFPLVFADSLLQLSCGCRLYPIGLQSQAGIAHCFPCNFDSIRICPLGVDLVGCPLQWSFDTVGINEAAYRYPVCEAYVVSENESEVGWPHLEFSCIVAHPDGVCVADDINQVPCCSGP